MNIITATKSGLKHKPEDKMIHSVTDAIEAVQDDNFMKDIRPARSAKGGDNTFGIWFRGQEKINYSLCPSILRRPGNESDSYIDEVSLCRHFQTMNPDASPRDATDFERMVIMQHYQTPTRLLDWTENLLVALYFAVRDPALDEKADAAVWVLNARRLNYHTSATTRLSLVAFPTDPDVIARSCLSRVRGRSEWHDVLGRELLRQRLDRENYRNERIARAVHSQKAVTLSRDSLNDANPTPFNLRQFEIKKNGRSSIINLFDDEVWKTPAGIYSRLRMPVAVHAPRSNRRITSQSGVFTLHGGRLEPIPMKSAHADAIGLPITIEEIEASLKKFRVAKWMLIPKRKRATFRKTLAQIGVTDASLFPELEYQSKYLVSRWTYRKEDERDEG